MAQLLLQMCSDCHLLHQQLTLYNNNGTCTASISNNDTESLTISGIMHALAMDMI